jgi:hypothetical protein
MALPGPANMSTIASGPFEASIMSVSSSPYSLALAMLALNMCGRFLPFEVTKEQEKFLNQPMVRRCLIYVIFFMATRNIIMSFWLGTVVIVCLAYLFNENSSLYIFGKVTTPKGKTVGDTLALTPEEQSILKNLQDKADRIKKQSEKPIELGVAQPVATHKQYEKIIQGLLVSN